MKIGDECLYVAISILLLAGAYFYAKMILIYHKCKQKEICEIEQMAEVLSISDKDIVEDMAIHLPYTINDIKKFIIVSNLSERNAYKALKHFSKQGITNLKDINKLTELGHAQYGEFWD